VAISIFTVSILGMMSVLASGVSSTSYARQKILAGYLAQEGIEYVRNMRDTYMLYPLGANDWDGFNNEFTSCKPTPGNPKGCGFNVTDFPYDFTVCQSNGGNCELYLDDEGYNITSGEETGFIRRVWVEEIEPDKEAKIFSKVEWTQGSGNKEVIFSENLFNWVE